MSHYRIHGVTSFGADDLRRVRAALRTRLFQNLQRIPDAGLDASPNEEVT